MGILSCMYACMFVCMALFATIKNLRVTKRHIKLESITYHSKCYITIISSQFDEMMESLERPVCKIGSFSMSKGMNSTEKYFFI